MTEEIQKLLDNWPAYGARKDSRPDLVRDALIAALEVPPRRLFPYVVLAAAYLDGKPIDAEPASEQTMHLSSLSREQLTDEDRVVPTSLAVAIRQCETVSRRATASSRRLTELPRLHAVLDVLPDLGATDGLAHLRDAAIALPFEIGHRALVHRIEVSVLDRAAAALKDIDLPALGEVIA